jgi:hypothetical protein
MLVQKELIMRHSVLLGTLIPAIFVTAALACDGPLVCTVIDPTGTPLNVRQSPNGVILATLKKGAQVEVLDHQDFGGERWALVAGYDDDASTLVEGGAWVFANYAQCEGDINALPADPYVLEWEQALPCTVTDPTGTPLNLRADPGGDIWGAVRNGTVLRASAIQQHKGKAWIYVNKWSDDNAIGWVFDPYLGCEEDA